jgi:hypothetical protein
MSFDDETEEERDIASWALKWMSICRKFRLDPSCITDELEYYIRKGSDA